MSDRNQKIFNLTVIVSALGYFVDIYDLLLFAIVRVTSLKDLRIPEEQMLSSGLLLLNAQMLGLLVGGLLWGILGDKRGRLSVLFGSIILYSIANLLNAHVQTLEQYAWLRFFAGMGLAGELGAAVTLVSEIMSKEKRTYGTTLVATIGIMGAVFGGWVAEHFVWRTAYTIGGLMGLILLVLRLKIAESRMFEQVKDASVPRGSLLLFFKKPEKILRLIFCFLVGVPLWFVIGILISFSPELTKELGTIPGPAKTTYAVSLAYLGCSLGDLFSGLLSQYLGSRRRVLYSFILAILVLIFVYAFSRGISLRSFYALCFVLGLSTGYWAVFMMNASEQFGTNLRATVTTLAPNLVRGAVVPMSLAFEFLQKSMSKIEAAVYVGVTVVILALISVRFLKETFGKDLNYVED